MRAVLAILLALVLAGAAAAQDGAAGGPGDDVSVDPAPEAAPDVAPVPVVPDAAGGSWWQAGSDPQAEFLAWAAVAERAEMLAALGQGSRFALLRLRAELVSWRDRFLVEQSVNAGRIRTVQAQIDALGPAPADGAVEDPAIAARRADLQAQLTGLRAPILLAQEAHARAGGLIAEIDTILRQAQTRRLIERGPSPLNPQTWWPALDLLQTRVFAIVGEWQAGLASESRRAAFFAALPGVVVTLGAGLLLLFRGRSVMARLGARVAGSVRRGQGVWAFLLSLGQIVLPLFGLVLLSTAVIMTGLGGFRSDRLIEALPAVGMNVILARWLAGQIFAPDRPFSAPLDFEADQRFQARAALIALGWTMAAGQGLVALLSTGEADPALVAVLRLPVDLLIALSLWRLSRILLQRPHQPSVATALPDNDPVAFRRGMLIIVARVAIAVAAGGSLAAMAGYSAAAEALLYPAITTLFLSGLIMRLQVLVFEFYALVTGAEDGSREGLLPVLVAFVLVLLAVPVLALVWGARWEDLAEIWARFNEGYSLGETRVSPTDLVWFMVIFGVGFGLTRLIQRTLRTTVLPKTRLDIGGQNAVVSGLGYVGIFLAAVVAITSAGIDLSSLAIVAGALSVGIGFGLQTIVSNFVSGIILLIERPISEGDWIEVGGQMGYVRGISVRSTRIETFDRTDVIIPNADLVSGQVTNWTRGNSVGRIIVRVGVAYGTDTHRVEAILKEIAEAHPMVLLSSPPAILFAGFGADSLDFEIRAILRDVSFSLGVKSEMHHQIAERFAAEGIEIPFAQRDIWLRNPETLRPETAAGAQPRTDPAAPPAKGEPA